MVRVEYTAEAELDLYREYSIYKLINPLPITCKICFTPFDIVLVVYDLSHVQLVIDAIKDSNNIAYSYTHYYMAEEDIPEQWFIRCKRV